MNAKYFTASCAIFLMGCAPQEPVKILEVGGNQLPQESASGQLSKDLEIDENIDKDSLPTNSQPYESMGGYPLQTPTGSGLDALPTLLIPSPSGNKIIILPPPSR